MIAGDTAGQKGEKPRSDLKRPWALVRREAGLEDLRIHDLRHNFGGFGAGGGYGLPIIGKLLGHSQPATTARYAHLDNDPVRKATNTIGAALAAAMGEPTIPKTLRMCWSRRSAGAVERKRGEELGIDNRVRPGLPLAVMASNSSEEATAASTSAFPS